MENKQAYAVARCMEDPSSLGDIMPVGFRDQGGGVVDDELAEEEGGRRWNDHGPRWVGIEGKKDGFMSTLTCAVSTLPEGKPLWGGPCQSRHKAIRGEGQQAGPRRPRSLGERNRESRFRGGLCVVG